MTAPAQPSAYSTVPPQVGHSKASATPTGFLMKDVYAFSKISSLEKKPEVPGMPMMAAHEAAKVKNVYGMNFFKPPMLRMSCDASVSWMRACMAWMTEPAPRNMQALKKACVRTWKKPAVKAPTP